MHILLLSPPPQRRSHRASIMAGIGRAAQRLISMLNDGDQRVEPRDKINLGLRAARMAAHLTYHLRARLVIPRPTASLKAQSALLLYEAFTQLG